jgi:competence protein ComEA
VADAETQAVTSDATSPEPQAERSTRPGRHARRSIGVAGLFSGWVHDRLPPTMQGRIGLAPGHVTAVALMVALALGVTAWWVLRADADGEPVPASSPADLSSAVTVAGPSGVPGPSPVGGSPSAGTAGAGEGEKAVVVVDVAGRVRRPGIATLPVGARVIDALDAAGGARPGVDLTSLNLARVLVDGEQIVVGVPPPGGIAAPAASAPQPANGTTSSTPLVNLNTATQVELEELPGVGPVTAAAILQWRTDNGAFTAVDELLEVSGIGDATLAEIAPFVTL